MFRLVSVLSRLATAVTLGLLALAVGRWPWIAARSPLDVTALGLALPAMAFAVLAALTGQARPASRWRAAAAVLGSSLLLLVLAVGLRGRAGLAAEVRSPSGEHLGELAARAIDLAGRDLRPFTGGRRASIRWAGELRVPESGRYRLWAQGRRGRVRVTVDGHPLLHAEGDPLRGAVETALARGSVQLEAVFEQQAPGPRLWLGWTRPDGTEELIPPRQLGPALPAWQWWLTDVAVWLAALATAALVWLAPWDVRRPLAAPTQAGWRELAIASGGYAVLLAVMSWPLVLDPVHSGPMDRTDARLNAWILAWSGTVWSDPAGVFQAPAFHPLADTLAFSENLLLPAALVAPLQPLAGPVLPYNVVLIGSLLLSGLGTHLLVRRAGGSPLAAFVAGAFFAAGPHRWTRLAHLHAQVTVFLPFVLLAFDRFWERRTLRRALVVGLLLALQGLASVYLGAITAAALAVAIALAFAAGLRGREALRLAAGLAFAAAALWPVMAPYLRMRAVQGQEWDPATVAGFAATLPSYAAAGTPLWGWLSERLLDPSTLRDALFPGLTVLVLGVAGLAAAPRRYRAVAIAASLAAILFSLGPETAFYRFLSEHVVLVRGVRALARFALVPSLALAVLAGLALSGRRAWLAGAALVAMMAESASLPLRLVHDEGPSPAARWLAGGQGAVLELPLAEDDTRPMLDNLEHRRPVVNGYSAFVPRPFDRAMELFGRGVDAEGLRFLRAVGVTHVVSPQPLALPEAAAFPSQHVHEVPDGPAAAIVEPGEPVPTRWAPDGIRLVLPAERAISSVVFELSNDEWLARPRVETSLDGVAWTAVDAQASLGDATLSLYRNPRHARGELRFAPRAVRFLRIEARLPARRATLEVR